MNDVNYWSQAGRGGGSQVAGPGSSRSHDSCCLFHYIIIYADIDSCMRCVSGFLHSQDIHVLGGRCVLDIGNIRLVSDGFRFIVVKTAAKL